MVKIIIRKGAKIHKENESGQMIWLTLHEEIEVLAYEPSIGLRAFMDRDNVLWYVDAADTRPAK